ncbi:MAG: hypothetical protein IPM56_16180 [Ignavibacteriales bacterium]|nr:MAG: hypothetical protein IPM56_16180 [Ignavibacteriales bacterium]
MENNPFDQVKNNLTSNAVMIVLTNTAKAFIVERVVRAEYLEGSSQGADQYSTTPMPIPYGAFVKKFGKALAQAAANDEDDISKTIKKGGKELTTASSGEFKVYTHKDGHTYVWIMKGYKRYRELSGKDTSRVTMHWTGRMMRNLGILRQETNAVQGVLGFPSPDEALKAYYAHVGAGKAKKKHLFMGLTQKEIDSLTSDAAALIVQHIQKL